MEEILNRILYKPIQMQLGLVNKSLIAHFLFDLRLDEHLTALRSYMLLENGEFAQTLVDHLVDKLFITNVHQSCCDVVAPPSSSTVDHLLDSICVNEALSRAVARVKNCKYVENLSIQVARRSDAPNEPNDLFKLIERVELVYELNWPLNIVLSEWCMRSYNRIFGLLLQIRLVLAVLNSVWHTLKRLGIIKYIKLFYELAVKPLPCQQVDISNIAKLLLFVSSFFFQKFLKGFDIFWLQYLL
jgi:gamma-tubulin complex component 6